MEKAMGISNAQRGAIFALAKVAHLESDALHGVVKRIAGVDSITLLTSWQAGKVIEALKRKTGQSAPWGWMTDAQRYKMYALCRGLGWLGENGAVDEKRLEGFIRERFGIAKLSWLKPDIAGKVINALSAMNKRGCGERRAKVPE